MPDDRRRIHHRASHVISIVTTFLGSFTAIVAVAGLVALWPSDCCSCGEASSTPTTTMVVTSVTTMITFVMVFIIQSTQNRESRAMQTKLDALLIAEHHLDDAELLGLEDRPDAAIRDVQTEVHDAERRSTGEGGRIAVPGRRLRSSGHPPK